MATTPPMPEHLSGFEILTKHKEAIRKLISYAAISIMKLFTNVFQRKISKMGKKSPTKRYFLTKKFPPKFFIFHCLYAKNLPNKLLLCIR